MFSETQQYENVRKYVLDNCELLAVIALDAYAFQPYTGQPTAVLILQKGAVSTLPVWFFDVVEDGFEKTIRKKGRRPAPDVQNDLVILRSVWSEKPESDRSFFVNVGRIRSNAYKLSLSAYRSERDDAKGWTPLGGPDGVCEIILGATPRTNTNEYWATGGKGYAWATITDMQDRYITSTERTITDAGVAFSSVKLVPKGTVLLSFKLSIGKVAITGCDLFTNEAIAGLVPKDSRVLPEYLYHLLPTINLRNYMQPAAKGKTLNKKILEGIRIPVPPLDQQAEFVEKMNELEAKAIGLRERANALDKDALELGKTFVVTFESRNRPTGEPS